MLKNMLAWADVHVDTAKCEALSIPFSLWLLHRLMGLHQHYIIPEADRESSEQKFLQMCNIEHINKKRPSEEEEAVQLMDGGMEITTQRCWVISAITLLIARLLRPSTLHFTWWDVGLAYAGSCFMVQNKMGGSKIIQWR